MRMVDRVHSNKARSKSTPRVIAKRSLCGKFYLRSASVIGRAQYHVAFVVTYNCFCINTHPSDLKIICISIACHLSSFVL